MGKKRYQGERSKGKKGTLMQCPRCRYKWRVKNIKKIWICCSNCKKPFKPSQGRVRKR